MLRDSDRKVTVNVSTILEKLENNYQEHVEILGEAREGWRDKMEKALKQAAANFRKTGVVDLAGVYGLQEPVDRTDQFKSIIAMLQLHRESGNETIEMTAQDVERFYLNTWVRDADVANAAYSVIARGKL